MDVFRVALILIWLSCVCIDVVSNCSWSNEGCSDDSECCSNSCHRAHEGTNARCRHSTLGERCVFDYHCQNTLICGPSYNCCSPYWKMCMKDSDCCQSDVHVCRAVDGFYYKRCLYPSGSATPTYYQNHDTRFLVFIAVIANQMLSIFNG